jgi:hypothetical protein
MALRVARLKAMAYRLETKGHLFETA